MLDLSCRAHKNDLSNYSVFSEESRNEYPQKKISGMSYRLIEFFATIYSLIYGIVVLNHSKDKHSSLQDINIIVTFKNVSYFIILFLGITIFHEMKISDKYIIRFIRILEILFYILNFAMICWMVKFLICNFYEMTRLNKIFIISQVVLNISLIFISLLYNFFLISID